MTPGAKLLPIFIDFQEINILEKRPISSLPSQNSGFFRAFYHKIRTLEDRFITKFGIQETKKLRQAGAFTRLCRSRSFRRLLHAEQFHLFLPGERQVGVEFRQRKRPRCSSGEDGVHDGRGQQRQPQKTPDVGHVHVQRFRQGFRRIEFTAVKELLPAIGSGNARGQRIVDLQLFVRQFRVVDPFAAVVVTDFDRNPDPGVAVLHLLNFGLHSPVPPEAAAFLRSGAPGRGGLRKA